MKRLALTAVLLLTGALAQGCGPTCEDACDKMVECSNKFLPDSDTAECVADCEEMNCSEESKEEMLQCLSDMACQNAVSYAAELIGCSARCVH